MRNAEVNICLTVTSRESLVELLGVGSAMVMKCFSTGIDWDVSQIRTKIRRSWGFHPNNWSKTLI